MLLVGIGLWLAFPCPFIAICLNLSDALWARIGSWVFLGLAVIGLVLFVLSFYFGVGA